MAKNKPETAVDTEITVEPATQPSLYERLAAPFDHTFSDNRGGVQLEYITGEQCVSRLNEALGYSGWSFEITEHGIHEEADEVWVRGRLSVYQGEINEEFTHLLSPVVREQFGSQKIKRSRQNRQPLDIGFDLKGAGTDALKKCASLIGVGLYLSRKEEQNRPLPPAGAATHGTPPANRTTPTRADEPASNGSGDFQCAECGEALTETRFRDGTIWPPAQLAGYGRRKHNRVLCMTHYREANSARQRAEMSQDIPF